MNELKECRLCPRDCKVNRYNSLGFCKASNKLRVALASIHMWEEPCISYKNGSGTIFFSHCNLKCVYCQNYSIRDGYGKDISVNRFSDICIELQNKKVHNINLVTPTHYVPQIINGISKARKKGLTLPIVYNTSGYESVTTIFLLNKTVDIYLTDLRYYDNKYGKKYSCVDNYFDKASKAIEVMYNQVGVPVFDGDILIKGVIVRVLLLPSLLEDAKNIIKYLYNKYQDNIIISIMNQYTPVKEFKYSELNRKVTDEEYNELIEYAYDLGVRNAFVQEDGTASESFIQKFDKEGV
mgnify:FL=1